MFTFLCLLAVFAYSAFADHLTGDAAADFEPLLGDKVRKVTDGIGPDVGTPPQIGRLSGWDVENVYIEWNVDGDALNFGIDCFGVCGDADGDGDEGRTSAELEALGGVDTASFSRGEGFAIALDFNLDTQTTIDNGGAASLPFDFIVGVPAGEPADASDMPMPGEVASLECARGFEGDELLNMPRCFGLYEYQNSGSVALARRFLRRLTSAGGEPWPVVNHNEAPTLAKPDLEFTINNLSALKALAGEPFGTPGDTWRFYLQAFAGSFLDDGVGEDYLPSIDSVSLVEFPCANQDLCGVCGGDSSTCGDCAGVPNGSNEYDECDVCAGDSSTCMDCQGIANGPAVYDLCDVCNGDSTTCADCLGVSGGRAAYDACDVCDGDNTSCADCAGEPNGPAVYDECDVCNGDGSTCCGQDGRECCVNYCDVPDAYWDFILLPVTLDDIIDKLHFTNEIFAWLCNALPPYEEIGPQSRDLYFGRMAEFNRVFLEECLEDFCESSGHVFGQLVADNANPEC